MAAYHDTPALPSRLLRTLLVSTGVLLSALLGHSQAQVPTTLRPDGTLGTAVTQSGSVYDITGGTRPGNGPNLFHSFDRFSVGTGETANFTSGQTGIKHILSRVTGGQRSDIYGQLRTDGQLRAEGANLYLLNPAGVVFGSNASLDVSGSFHVSTADVLRFADGATFAAHLGEKSTLTVAPPVAFGFLGSNPAPISIQESTLQVSEGKALSVVGGDMQIRGGTLRAPSGRVQLASVASPGDVRFTPLELVPELQGDASAQLGRVELSQGARVDASGAGVAGRGGPGGTVLIRSGRLLVDQAQLLANTVGETDGASRGIDLQIAAEATMAHGALVTTESQGAGRAGELRMVAGSVSMEDAVVASSAFAAGRGGDVALQVGSLTLTGGAQIHTSTWGSGGGGTLTVAATEALSVSGQDSGLFSNAYASGNGGNLDVRAGQLTLTGGPQINGVAAFTITGIVSRAHTASTGDPGIVSVHADRLVIDGGTGPVLTGIGSATHRGSRGNTWVLAQDLEVRNGGAIFSITSGPGQAGVVAVQAERLLLTGVSGAQPGPVSSAPARIESSAIAGSTGASGEVRVRAGTLEVRPGGAITSTTLGPGTAGAVGVQADRLRIVGGDHFTGIASTAGIGPFAGGTFGAAGSIQVNAGELAIHAGGVITSATFGPEPAGTVEVQAHRLVLTGLGTFVAPGAEAPFPSRIESSAEPGATGAGGTVQITAHTLVLADHGTIATRSFSPRGNAGNITLHVEGALELRRGAVLTTEARQADGGNIQITAPRLVRLRDSTITAEVGGGAMTVGGNITIDTQFVVLQHSQIVANAFEGQGGNIRIQAQTFLRDPASLVDASSALGINGQVNIQAPVTSLSGVVAPLTPDFARATALLQDRCAGRLREGRVSRLVLGGRDGVPSEPGSLLPSPLTQMDPREPGGPAGTPARPGQVQERAWYAQAGTLAGLEAECARWTGHKGPTVRGKR